MLFSTALFTSSVWAQTTGFNQAGAGPHDFNYSANWVGGGINGVWDSSLTLTAAQTATFGADTTLTSGLNFGYTGNFDLTLRSAGTANRTITLAGDIVVNPVSNRTITLGSTTANQGLNIDLGGVNRSITVNTSKVLTFLNAISNGDFTLTGNSPTAAGGTMKLAGAGGNAASSDITVTQGGILQFDSSTSGVTGTTRAQSVTLQSSGRLLVSGNSTANSADSISGNLVINGASPLAQSAGNTVPTVTLSPNAARNTRLTFTSVDRQAQGVAVFRGTNLGANTIASNTANSGNIEITGTAPTLVGGGGAAGTTSISIVPWALGGTSGSDIGSTFVTYTAANGIRPLNTGTEFAAAFGSATDNVRLTASSAISSGTTANSLILGSASTVLSGAGTLSVTSGAVFFASTSQSISAPLDFGSAQGVIGMARAATISGNISGTGGLALYGLRTDELLTLSGTSSTYTGDTHILGAAIISNGVLPSGARTGDVYVQGTYRLPVTGGTASINGLNGSGFVTYGNSTAAALSLGGNNANGTFTGTISNSASTLSLTKTGTGTQILSGANTYNGATNVNSGALELNNTTGSGTGTGTVTIAAAATLQGDGAITTAANNYVYINGTFQMGRTGATAGSDFTLNTSGTGSTVFGAVSYLDIDLWSTTGADQSGSLAAADMLRLFGTLDITSGATLKLSNPNTLTFQNGDIFRIFDWTGLTTRTGTFTEDFTDITLAPGLSIDSSNLYTLGTISIVGVPEPSRAILLMLGLTGLMLRRRKSAVHN
ncbi:MAG: autotransporter-associated beta strand repeat-containing protein [Verrucomicrobiaceae bacterium]|nr:autotransporter-associated beta strand repeat-containing protein [Verrucomicrobiaceae bacterium]